MATIFVGMKMIIIEFAVIKTAHNSDWFKHSVSKLYIEKICDLFLIFSFQTIQLFLNGSKQLWKLIKLKNKNFDIRNNFCCWTAIITVALSCQC